jgi:hypothetical protein
LRPIQDQSKLLNVQERYIKRESESISSSLPFPRLREVGDLFDWELKKVSFSANRKSSFPGRELGGGMPKGEAFFIEVPDRHRKSPGFVFSS